MMPPASRIRVTTVASVPGIQSLKVSVPRRQGTPATAILSFRQKVLPLRRSLFGAVLIALNFHAHAASGFESVVGKWMSDRG